MSHILFLGLQDYSLSSLQCFRRQRTAADPSPDFSASQAEYPWFPFTLYLTHILASCSYSWYSWQWGPQNQVWLCGWDPCMLTVFTPALYSPVTGNQHRSHIPFHAMFALQVHRSSFTRSNILSSYGVPSALLSDGGQVF